jgi:diguanylate cyclase (GGDEF)-like protein
MDRLTHLLGAAPASGPGCAVLFLDLDGFKPINDTFGHRAGDEILSEVARRLAAGARAVDTIGRIGGDEFVLLCDHVDVAAAGRVADRIREQLHRPLTVQGADVEIRGSIGIAMSEPGSTAEEMLRDADAAMYVVKSGGKDAHAVFPATPPSE